MIEIFERIMLTEFPNSRRDEQPCPFAVGHGVCKKAASPEGCSRCKGKKTPSKECLKALKAACSQKFLAEMAAGSLVKSA